MGGEGEWKYGAGEVFLKEGRWNWDFLYLIFSRFIISTFRNYFTLSKSVLIFEEKKFFFCHHKFLKKRHSKLSKIESENIP